MSEKLPYEESAEFRTGITGWVCKTCLRYWGEDEDMARYCCARDCPCECGGRRERHYTICKACRDRGEDERWHTLDQHEWDGETPLMQWRGDRFFFSADDLYDYLDCNNLSPEEVRLVLCELVNPPIFDMHSHLDDYPSTWDDLDRKDVREIEKVVNGWVEANVGPFFEPTEKRVSATSIRACLGINYLPLIVKQEGV